MGSLTSLTTLDLSDNQLSGTIPDLSSLTQLQNLYLGDNQLSGTIPDLSSLTQLQNLYLGDNRLSGTIPEELGRTSTSLYRPCTSDEQPAKRADPGPSWAASSDCDVTRSLRDNTVDGADPGRAGQPQRVAATVP